jgi:hypothetical protein
MKKEKRIKITHSFYIEDSDHCRLCEYTDGNFNFCWFFLEELEVNEDDELFFAKRCKPCLEIGELVD